MYLFTRTHDNSNILNFYLESILTRFIFKNYNLYNLRYIKSGIFIIYSLFYFITSLYQSKYLQIQIMFQQNVLYSEGKKNKLIPSISKLSKTYMLSILKYSKSLKSVN